MKGTLLVWKLGTATIFMGGENISVRYIENNPVRAKIVKKAHEYTWSSASAHVAQEANPIPSNDCYLIKEINNYIAYLTERDGEAVINEIRQHTKTGDALRR